MLGMTARHKATGTRKIEAESLLELVPRHLPGWPDRSLNRGVVDQDVDPSGLIRGLTHMLRRIRITEIAAERHYFTVGVFRLYLGGNVGERNLIARDEQQIGTMRSKLAGAQPA